MAADANCIIEVKKQKARDIAAANADVLTRKQLAGILDVSLSTLSNILSKLPPEMIIKEKTPGGRGGILIPLSTALYLIETRYEVY
jgi:hypothetical protein